MNKEKMVTGNTVRRTMQTLQKKGIDFELFEMVGPNMLQMYPLKNGLKPDYRANQLDAMLERGTLSLRFEASDDSYEISFGYGVDFVAATGTRSYNIIPMLDVMCIDTYLESIEAKIDININELVR